MSKDQDPGCLGSILQAFGLAPQPAAPDIEFLDEEVLPYHLRDDFLSPAELNFYRILCVAAGDWAVICPKVSLGDLFYAQAGDYATNAAYRNKIDRKHVDFLLCDRRSMIPLVGVELDDASHRRAYRSDRDRFIPTLFSIPMDSYPSEWMIIQSIGFDTPLQTLTHLTPSSPPQTSPPNPPASPPPCRPQSAPSNSQDAKTREVWYNDWRLGVIGSSTLNRGSPGAND